MEQDAMCDAGLVLGLNIYDNNNNNSVDDQPLIGRRFDHLGSKLLERSSSNATATHEPSLTLGLSTETREIFEASCSIKIEKDVSGLLNINHDEDVGDEDDDGSARKKLRLTKEQSVLLELKFKEHTTLNPKQKLALAKQLKLRPRQVEVWFQNRRARTKLKQTQINCEFLKKCYESLRVENRRLHKEVQELKALELSSGHYNRTMCPSCETKTTSIDAGRPVVYNSFSHSAAC